MYTPREASEAQVRFIRSLLAQRAVGPDLAGEVEDRLSTFLDVRTASSYIDQLKALTFEPSSVTFDLGPDKTALTAALAEVPLSKYALDFDVLRGTLTRTTPTSDASLLFVEVREYKGHRYLRQLLGGGLGDFTRVKVDRDDSLGILAVIARDPLTAIQCFGEHYTCCGKCGKPLTDDLSRERSIGPDCWKALTA